MKTLPRTRLITLGAAGLLVAFAIHAYAANRHAALWWEVAELKQNTSADDFKKKVLDKYCTCYSIDFYENDNAQPKSLEGGNECGDIQKVVKTVKNHRSTRISGAHITQQAYFRSTKMMQMVVNKVKAKDKP
jgi:hypothetical protein